MALKKQLLFHLKTIQNIFVTLLADPQVSDRCPLGYLLFLSVDKNSLIWARNRPTVHVVNVITV